MYTERIRTQYLNTALVYSSTKYIFFGCFCLPNWSPIKIRGNQWIQWKKCVRWKKCVYSHQWENVFEKKVVAFVMTCGSIIHMVWCNDTDERNFIDKEKNFINEEKMRFRRKLWQIWSSCNQSQTLTVKKKEKKIERNFFPSKRNALIFHSITKKTFLCMFSFVDFVNSTDYSGIRNHENFFFLLCLLNQCALCTTLHRSIAIK